MKITNLYRSRLSAPLASTPVKNKLSEDIPGSKLCQRGSPVTSSVSPVTVKFHYITVFLLFLGGKWSILFPGRNFKLNRVTWPGCLYIATVKSYIRLNYFFDNSNNRLNASPRFSSKYSFRASYLLFH